MQTSSAKTFSMDFNVGSESKGLCMWVYLYIYMYIICILKHIYMLRTTEKGLHNKLNTRNSNLMKKTIESLAWASVLGLDPGSNVVVSYARVLVSSELHSILMTKFQTLDSTTRLCKFIVLFKHYNLFFAMWDGKVFPFYMQKRRHRENSNFRLAETPKRGYSTLGRSGGNQCQINRYNWLPAITDNVDNTASDQKLEGSCLMIG